MEESRSTESVAKKYNGTWLIPDVPSEFTEILKHIGYGKLERHVFKKSKVLIHSTLKDDVLTLKIESGIYKNTHEYILNDNPKEYLDEKKNQIIEICGWIEEDKIIQTKTIYPDKGITLIDLRELLESGDCLHKLTLYRESDDPLEAQITYLRQK